MNSVHAATIQDTVDRYAARGCSVTQAAVIDYRGRYVTVLRVSWDDSGRYSCRSGESFLWIEGPATYRIESTSADGAAAYVRGKIDTAAEDAEILPRLVKLTTANPAVIQAPDRETRVGDTVRAYGTGKARVGIVVKVGRVNVTVAYTTPSNPDRVYRATAKIVTA